MKRLIKRLEEKANDRSAMTFDDIVNEISSKKGLEACDDILGWVADMWEDGNSDVHDDGENFIDIMFPMELKYRSNRPLYAIKVGGKIVYEPDNVATGFAMMRLEKKGDRLLFKIEWSIDVDSKKFEVLGPSEYEQKSEMSFDDFISKGADWKGVFNDLRKKMKHPDEVESKD